MLFRISDDMKICYIGQIEEIFDQKFLYTNKLCVDTWDYQETRYMTYIVYPWYAVVCPD